MIIPSQVTISLLLCDVQITVRWNICTTHCKFEFVIYFSFNLWFLYFRVFLRLLLPWKPLEFYPGPRPVCALASGVEACKNETCSHFIQPADLTGGHLRHILVPSDYDVLTAVSSPFSTHLHILTNSHCTCPLHQFV